jgi:hypothetical protein
MKFSLKFKLVTAALFLFSSHQPLAATIPGSTRHSKEWMEGYDLAARAIFPGSFAKGFGLGLSTPVVAFLGVIAVPEKIGGATGIVTGILWIWGGGKLLSSQEIKIPDERLNRYIDQPQRTDFINGYNITAQSKRISCITLGVMSGLICGTITTALLLLPLVTITGPPGY